MTSPPPNPPNAASALKNAKDQVKELKSKLTSNNMMCCSIGTDFENSFSNTGP